MRILLLTSIAFISFSSCKKEESQNQVTTPKWSTTTEFAGEGRQTAVAFSIGNKGYVGLGTAGGGNNPYIDYSDFWEFDPMRSSWDRKADFPGTKRGGATSFTIGEKGYVVNGLCGCNDFWQYDPLKNSWTRKADFPVSDIYYTAAFVLNGKAYVGTGIKDGTLQKGIWEYDPSLDKWTRKENFPGTAMDLAVSFSIGGKGYFATGIQAIGVSKALWQYDPSTDTWTRKADFPYETYGSVGFSINNKGYIGLGHAGSEFWEYDPNKDVWTKTTNFTPGWRTGAKAFVINDKAYVGLGTPSWTVYLKDMWVLSIN